MSKPSKVVLTISSDDKRVDVSMEFIDRLDPTHRTPAQALAIFAFETLATKTQGEKHHGIRVH